MLGDSYQQIEVARTDFRSVAGSGRSESMVALMLSQSVRWKMENSTTCRRCDWLPRRVTVRSWSARARRDKS